jgi:small subunit ribosomal protein S3
MGHKVHPGGLRVGIIHTWKSNWFTTSKDFSGYLSEDFKIRDHIYGKLSHAGLSDIHIRKDKQKVTVDIYTARPGIVIGKSGSEVDALRKELHDMTGKAVQVNITEIKRPELDAKLVAQSIAEQLQNRVSFRRAMKRSLSSSMRSGAQGVKIRCGGRLGGAEMSRTESYSEGRVPLHTLRADIDYGFAEAKTTFGRIGVKVWINKGEIMPEGFERDAAGTRLGEVDTRRRRGGRPGDAEQLGPARPQRRSGGGSGGGGGRDGGGRGRRPRQGQNDPSQSGDPNAGAGGRRARPRPPAAPAAPEAAAPETAAPDTAAPETAAPEAAAPETAAPAAAAPETAAPETAAPEAAAPEAAAPEAAAPEAAAPEAAAPEAAAPEAAAPEAAAPEAAVAEPAAPKKASAKKPAAKKPAAKKPAAEKAEKPAPEEPAAEAPAPEAPEGGDA